MNRKVKNKAKYIFLALFILGMFMLTAGQYLVLNRIFEGKITYLTNEIDKGLDKLAIARDLDTVAQKIKYYDEVLTQSARNYVFTQKESWKNRYTATEPLLDADISKAIDSGSDFDMGIFSQIDEANLALVDLELNSIELVDEKKISEALAILEGSQYKDYKHLYSQGLNHYLEVKSQENTRAFNKLEKTMGQEINKLGDLVFNIVLFQSIFLGIFTALVALIVFFAYLISRQKGSLL